MWLVLASGVWLGHSPAPAARGRPRRSKEQAEAALKQTEAEHIRVEHLLLHIWSSLSLDYGFSRHYDLAEQYGQQALAGFRATNAPPKFHASVLNTLGMVAWWRGQYDLAETLLREAITLWREGNQFTDLLRSLYRLPRWRSNTFLNHLDAHPYSPKHKP